ncbi:hypothetical protein MCOR28_009125 [Pyricularia oryzae]|nr:hypothetical protein MCOR28_009125 [Pyricularia oryzae]
MTAMESTPRIIYLAAEIHQRAAELQNVLDAKGFPTPSFDEDSPTRLPDEASEAQDAILDAAAELYDLLLEPTTLILKNSANNNVGSLGFIARFNIPGMVPLGGQMSFAEIAKKTGFAEGIVARFMRDAVCRHIFCETETGFIRHTKTSKALREPWFLGFLKAGAEEGWGTMSKVLDALQKWPDCQEPEQTAFNLVHKTEGSYFSNVAKDQERAARFSAGMKIQWEFPGYKLDYLFEDYDWSSLGHVQVIDLGGFRGRISLALAQRFPNLSMLVQDMGMNEEEAHAAVPAELKSRVKFMTHDMFDEQTVAADVYFIRQVLHDWPDKYNIKVLRAQIPKLKPGSRILLNESLLPEKPGSAMDMGLIATMNGRERTLNEWKAMIKEADPRFLLTKVSQSPGSMLAVFEIVWTP